MRHGDRRRVHRARAAYRRLYRAPGRHPVAGRPLPRVRCARAGHGVRQRRGRDRAEARRRRARGRRPHLCGDPRHRDQQRRRVEGQLHGVERERAGEGDARRVRVRGRRAARGRLRRDARHRHGGRRSARNRRADQGVPAAHAGRRLLRGRLGEDQHRAPRTGVGGGERDQGRARARSRADSAEPEFRHAEPEDSVRADAVLREHRAARLAARRRAALRGRQLARARRHERVRGARGGARAPGGGSGSGGERPAAARACAVGPLGARACRARGPLAPVPGDDGRAHRRPLLHREHRPRAAQRAADGGGRHGRRAVGAARGRAGDGARRQAAAGVPVYGPGRAVRGNGGRAVPHAAGVPRRARPLRRAVAPASRHAAAVGPLRRCAGEGADRPDRLRAAGALCDRMVAGRAVAIVGHRAGRGARPQRRRIRGGLRRGLLRPRRVPRADRRARPADAGAAEGRRDGGAVRRRRDGRAAARRERPAGDRDRRVQRAREHCRVGPRGRRRRRVRARAAGGHWRARADGVACVPFAADGERGGRARNARGQLSRQEAEDSARREPDRRDCRCAADASLLARPRVAAGAFHFRRAGARAGRHRRFRRSRPRHDARVARAADPGQRRGRRPALSRIDRPRPRMGRADGDTRRAVAQRCAGRLARVRRALCAAPRVRADLRVRARTLLARRRPGHSGGRRRHGDGAGRRHSRQARVVAARRVAVRGDLRPRRDPVAHRSPDLRAGRAAGGGRARRARRGRARAGGRRGGRDRLADLRRCARRARRRRARRPDPPAGRRR
ncbi:hypothetical protein BST28156_04022 [Burkholderia stagnalis]|nr:hypothetical protein BST28156_04022 [Burkholderia stagnalis]